MSKIQVPVQVAQGWPLRVRGAGDASGGHSVAEFETVADVRDFMVRNPSAAMPCWQNPTAIWNQG